MEDDCLITKVTVETDMLLEQFEAKSDGSGEETDSNEEKSDNNDARLIITVRLRPYQFHFRNMKFA